MWMTRVAERKKTKIDSDEFAFRAFTYFEYRAVWPPSRPLAACSFLSR